MSSSPGNHNSDEFERTLRRLIEEFSARLCERAEQFARDHGRECSKRDLERAAAEFGAMESTRGRLGVACGTAMISAAITAISWAIVQPRMFAWWLDCPIILMFVFGTILVTRGLSRS